MSFRRKAEVRAYSTPDKPRPAPSGIKASRDAERAWDEALAMAAPFIPRPTMESRMRGVVVLGARKNCLCVATDDSIIPRRYGKVLGEAVRRTSSYEGLGIYDKEEER